MDSKPTSTPAAAPGDSPEEYIRTFSGDIDIFKKGGTPGLAPLKPLGSVPDGHPTTELNPATPAAVPAAPAKPIIPIPDIVAAPIAAKPVPQAKDSSQSSDKTTEKPAIATREPIHLSMPTMPPQKKVTYSDVTPEKYIRTFSSDMDVFQKGGVPGLAPLKPLGAASKEHLAETHPAQSAKPIIKIPAPIAAPPAPLPMVPMRHPVPAERLVASSPIPPAPVFVPSPAPAPVAPPKPVEPAPSPIETYSQDFNDRVKTTNASTAAIIAAEQDAGQFSQPTPESPRSKTRNVLYVVAGLLIFAVGGVGVYVVYQQFLTKVAPVIVSQGIQTPIFYDTQDTVSGSGATLMQAIAQSAQASLAPNTVRLLTLDSPSANVFTALATPVPGIVVRNINQSGNMAGIAGTDGGQSPFFILSVSSYSATFSGMLAWESTMQKDLNALYPLYPAPAAPVATTTPLKGAKMTKQAPVAPVAVAPQQTEGFRDEVVSNHDVRIYRDAFGRSIVLYGYWNQSTLVIARDPAAFAEIIGRLSTSHS